MSVKIKMWDKIGDLAFWLGVAALPIVMGMYLMGLVGGFVAVLVLVAIWWCCFWAFVVAWVICWPEM